MRRNNAWSGHAAAKATRTRVAVSVAASDPQFECLTSCQGRTGCQRDMISLRMLA